MTSHADEIAALRMHLQRIHDYARAVSAKGPAPDLGALFQWNHVAGFATAGLKVQRASVIKDPTP